MSPPPGPVPSPPTGGPRRGWRRSGPRRRFLPEARRAFGACEDLEDRFDALDSRRLNVLRRLLRTPAPDLAALALKLDLAVAHQAWELSGAETCIETCAADAWRLAGGG